MLAVRWVHVPVRGRNFCVTSSLCSTEERSPTVSRCFFASLCQSPCAFALGSVNQVVLVIPYTCASTLLVRESLCLL